LPCAAFKKGPDYIDAGWLGLAAGGACYNLDSYLCDTETVKASFIKRATGKDAAIVEGNRGLFDGVDSAGSYSTAELAKTLAAPLILIVDATKMTRTAAALVMGCKVLDPELDLKGVILNRVGGARHERVLRDSIESATEVPVIGAVRRLAQESFPQRHLGLVPLYEHPKAKEFIEEAATIATNSIDLDRLTDIAESAGKIDAPSLDSSRPADSGSYNVRIGVIRDSAFQFYYPENLEALQEKGSVIEISALRSRELPDLHGLYIGGGFPETHAEELASNVIFKESLRSAVLKGLPVYAECGGLMYLSKALHIDDKSYPMVGVLPVETVLEPRPQGHGYIRVQVTSPNPFYPLGAEIKGHEFHYSYITGLKESGVQTAFRVLRGHGMGDKIDGILVKNALATYAHVHALGEPSWAEGLLRRAADFKEAGTL
jgi:cobyrinic acid a,c-diamide synthase